MRRRPGWRRQQVELRRRELLLLLLGQCQGLRGRRQQEALGRGALWGPLRDLLQSGVDPRALRLGEARRDRAAAKLRQGVAAAELAEVGPLHALGKVAESQLRAGVAGEAARHLLQELSSRSLSRQWGRCRASATQRTATQAAMTTRQKGPGKAHICCGSSEMYWCLPAGPKG